MPDNIQLTDYEITVLRYQKRAMDASGGVQIISPLAETLAQEEPYKRLANLGLIALQRDDVSVGTIKISSAYGYILTQAGIDYLTALDAADKLYDANEKFIASGRIHLQLPEVELVFDKQFSHDLSALIQKHTLNLPERVQMKRTLRVRVGIVETEIHDGPKITFTGNADPNAAFRGFINHMNNTLNED